MMEKSGDIKVRFQGFQGLELQGLVFEMFMFGINSGVMFRSNSGSRCGAGHPRVLQFHDFPVYNANQDFLRWRRGRGRGDLIARVMVLRSRVGLALIPVSSVTRMG